MKYLYEEVKYERNIPAKILMQDKPGWRSRTKLHWHKEIELIYMIDGHLDITKNGRKNSLENDGLSLCNSEEIHIVDVDDDKRYNRYLVVLLSYDYLKKHYKKLDSVYFNLNDNLPAQKKIKEAMKNLVKFTENSDDDYIDIRKNIEILKICHTLLSECKVYKKNNLFGKTSGNFKYAKTVIEYIGENYKEEITLGNMADLVGLTPAYFSKYFKNVTETSFSNYLNGVRLEHAIQDMLTRNLSVTDAALENGFPNVKSYISMCKKIYGCTPTQYKKNYPEY